MVKHIKFLAPELSQLKEVDVDVELTGKHYRDLKLSEGQLPEQVMLSILKDLVKQDANKLTLNEAKHIFTIIKINSLQNEYKAIVKCTHKRKDGKECGCTNKFTIKYSDSNVNQTPKGYKVPTISILVNKTEGEYRILPPTIDMEIAIYDWFLQTRNLTPQNLTEDKSNVLDFSWIRGVCHLVDADGNRVVNDVNEFEDVLTWMDDNKFSTIEELNKKTSEVNLYGLSMKLNSGKCKECGGNLVFQLPLLYGLSD